MIKLICKGNMMVTLRQLFQDHAKNDNTKERFFMILKKEDLNLKIV